MFAEVQAIGCWMLGVGLLLPVRGFNGGEFVLLHIRRTFQMFSLQRPKIVAFSEDF